jgi:hypothetical protein
VLLGQPLLACPLLTLRAVAILAGVIAVAEFAAVRTGVDVSSHPLGAALLDIRHGSAMAGQHLATELGPIGRTIVAKEGGYVVHVRSSISSLMEATAGSLVLWVRWV